MKNIFLYILLVAVLLTTGNTFAIDTSNCFLQQNGDLVCYDKKTGRRIVLKK